MYTLSAFSIKHFLAENWQRKPCVLHNALPNFEDPLDEHDLAGLAQEQDIDSRVISQLDDDWKVTEGPFTEFEDVCKGAWTLLVQGVDTHIESASLLMNAFNFIPHWRMDDLLVSFSQPGAGVGAHIDQYDVFIVQGKGTRRWQVGDKSMKYAKYYPHPKLQQIDEFEPIIDVNLLPGDILYIPPGFPHKGQSITECMNYSVGFRAPDQTELFQAIADDLLDSDKLTRRFIDRNRTYIDRPSAISPKDIMLLKQLLQQYVTNTQIDQVLTQHLSKQNEYLDAFPLETPLPSSYILALINQGVTLQLACGVRPVYLDYQVDDEFIFFINGHKFSTSATARLETSRILDNHQTFIKFNAEMTHDWIELIRELINLGYLEIVEED